MKSSPALISFFRLPRIESYFNKCARVAGLVKSLTATKSISSPVLGFASAARNTLRPMRPKPLMPTFTAICDFLLHDRSRPWVEMSSGLCGVWSAPKGDSTKLLIVPPDGETAKAAPARSAPHPNCRSSLGLRPGRSPVCDGVHIVCSTLGKCGIRLARYSFWAILPRPDGRLQTRLAGKA